MLQLSNRSSLPQSGATPIHDDHLTYSNTTEASATATFTSIGDQSDLQLVRNEDVTQQQWSYFEDTWRECQRELKFLLWEYCFDIEIFIFFFNFKYWDFYFLPYRNIKYIGVQQNNNDSRVNMNNNNGTREGNFKQIWRSNKKLWLSYLVFMGGKPSLKHKQT